MTPDEVNQAPIINSKDLNIYNKNSDSEDEDIPKFQFSLFKKRDLHPNVRNFIPPPKIPSSKNIRKKDSTFLNFDPDCLVAKLKSSISINHSCSKGIPFITKRPKTHSNLFRKLRADTMWRRLHISGDYGKPERREQTIQGMYSFSHSVNNLIHLSILGSDDVIYQEVDSGDLVFADMRLNEKKKILDKSDEPSASKLE